MSRAGLGDSLLGSHWEGLDEAVWALFLLVLAVPVAVVVYRQRRHVARPVDRQWNRPPVPHRWRAAAAHYLLACLTVTAVVVGPYSGPAKLHVGLENFFLSFEVKALFTLW